MLWCLYAKALKQACIQTGSVLSAVHVGYKQQPPEQNIKWLLGS